MDEEEPIYQELPFLAPHQASYELKENPTPPLRRRHHGHSGTESDYISGTIKFLHLDGGDMGHRERDYVIIEEDAHLGDTLEYITRKWNLGAPKLVISLMGGYQSIKQMTKTVKNTFRRELVNAVLSTGAWLTTGGLHHGMTQIVGEALRDYAIGRAMAEHRSVVVLGIAPISILKHKQKLVQGQKPVKYKLDPSDNTANAQLDPNHTHFIVVNDEGVDAAGAEIEAQCKLLEEISRRMIEGSNTAGIPVVCIVLGGGLKRIKAVHQLVVENKTPVIILEGSGGAADVLAFACRNMNKRDVVNRSGAFSWTLTASLSKAMAKALKSFNKILREEFGVDKINAVEEELIDWCREIAENPDLVTILSVKSSHGANVSINIEENILNALLKSKRVGQRMSTPGHGSVNSDQLHLAAVLNRIDLAEKLLKDETNLDVSIVRQSLRFALAQDQVKLVRLFLNKGLSLYEYLSVRELTSLYKMTNNDTLLYELLDAELETRNRRPVHKWVTLRDVGMVIKKLTSWNYSPLYLQETIADRENRFPNPSRELFLWAVLQGRLDMANLFWRESKAPIGGALLASKILKEMAKIEHDLHETRRIVKYDEGGRQYEELAVGVLDECYLSDRKRTSLIIVRNLTSWGSSNCLDLANAAGNLKFIAHPAVQNMLKEFWMGKLSLSNPEWQIRACIVFPPLVFLFRLKLKEEEADPLLVKSLPRGTSKGTILIRKKPVRRASTNLNKSTRRWLPFSLGPRTISRDEMTEDHATHQQLEGTTSTANLGGLSRRKALKSSQRNRGDNERKVSILRRIKSFFLVPTVIFTYNVISMVTFLAIFSYVLLQELHSDKLGHKHFHPVEYVLLVWFLSLCTEIVRQVLLEDAKKKRKRLRLWISYFWNQVDIAKTILFITGYVLRFIPDHDCLTAARIILAVALILFYVRLLHVFSANKHLGPKLIMIQKMFADLLVFLAVLLVFLVAYGVSSEAVLHPGRTNTNTSTSKIFIRVFYRPYIQMFGEGLDPENNFDEEDCKDHDYDDCPENGWFGAILLCIYLFLSNVLLLNLLIAMFNYTFTAVQENTDVYWKYQRYKLIREYYKRPPLPPPFILFSHAYLTVKYVVRNLILACQECRRSAYCSCWKQRSVFNPDLPPLTQASLYEITTWESVKGEDYLANERERQQHDTHKRQKNTDRRIQELTQSVAKLVGDMNSINTKLESMETLLIQKLGPPKDDSDSAFENIPDATTLELYNKETCTGGGRLKRTKTPKLKFQRAVGKFLESRDRGNASASDDDQLVVQRPLLTSDDEQLNDPAGPVANGHLAAPLATDDPVASITPSASDVESRESDFANNTD